MEQTVRLHCVRTFASYEEKGSWVRPVGEVITVGEQARREVHSSLRCNLGVLSKKQKPAGLSIS